MPKNNKGYIVEELVSSYLIKSGNRVVARNYRTKYGEIDIIYREKSSGTLVFAEVKYRKNSLFGSPYEFVDRGKIRKLNRAIYVYLGEHNIPHSTPMRLDVFSVLGDGSVKHFKAIDTDY